MGRVTSKGQVRVKQVAVPPKPQMPRVVERVRIPRLAANGRIETHAKIGEGVLIGGVWVVFTGVEVNRVSFVVDAPREIKVCPACPVTLET